MLFNRSQVYKIPPFSPTAMFPRMPPTATLQQAAKSRISNSPHLGLSPLGRVYFLQPTGEATAVHVSENNADRSRSKLVLAFKDSSAVGLLELAKADLPADWPAEFAFWKNFAQQLAQSFCCLDEGDRDQFSTKNPANLQRLVPPPDDLQLSVIVSEAPPMRGLEYLAPRVLTNLWLDLRKQMHEHALATTGGMDGLLQAINPDWQPLGRVTFHLAENKKDESRPFAFLATFTNRLSKQATVKHLPLADALRQFAGEKKTGETGRAAQAREPGGSIQRVDSIVARLASPVSTAGVVDLASL